MTRGYHVSVSVLIVMSIIVLMHVPMLMPLLPMFRDFHAKSMHAWFRTMYEELLHDQRVPCLCFHVDCRVNVCVCACACANVCARANACACVAHV